MGVYTTNIGIPRRMANPYLPGFEPQPGGAFSWRLPTIVT
ncbi:hypothetical protein D3OALGA1CA_1048 [Olavius algarvensis associated proteobacterium Delta 3]|nr:hypothetical protein D3OALGA1CA_1048 [Olavius algarvensis associated proteobacterium Delta 3]